jgi:hypothetical protein
VYFGDGVPASPAEAPKVALSDAPGAGPTYFGDDATGFGASEGVVPCGGKVATLGACACAVAAPASKISAAVVEVSSLGMFSPQHRRLMLHLTTKCIRSIVIMNDSLMNICHY